MSEKEKIQDTHVYFPESIYQQIVLKADDERRSVNSQILILIERGIACTE